MFRFVYLFFLYFLFFILTHDELRSTQTPQSYTIIEDQAKLRILTPTFSEKKTIKIRLDNGLEALLISDPRANKSAAALSVQIGSWHEPAEYPGLAHFLEHMLFLGTKKYPNESEYQRFISEYGGSTNAFTSNDFTSYLFSVNHEALPEALDRFAHFFIDPLFNPSGVARELNAIDQEFAKNFEDDDIREIYVIKELGNPDHPHHRFNMGNSQTLSNVSQETLKKWYQEHYSANLMRLVVYSILPLDQLIDLVVKEFSAIPNQNLERKTWDPPLTSSNLTGKMVYIEPIKNIRTLTLIWELPQQFAEMKESRPDKLICYVLGHEGRESLLNLLKDEQLAESLNCSTARMGGKNQYLYVEIELTDEGVQKVYRVIDLYFQMIAALKQKGIPQYIFDEMQQMEKLNYQYQKREDAFLTAMHDARGIVLEELSTFPEREKITQKFDPQAIKEMLNIFSAKDGQFYLMAPSSLTKISPNHREQWMNVAYSIQTIPPDKMKVWEEITERNNHLNIPEQNPLIPKRLSLVIESFPERSELPLVPHPIELVDNEFGKIYYAGDQRYQVPEIYYYFEIKTPQIELKKPLKTVKADLYVKFLKESLNHVSYLASLAGLNFSIERQENGISITIHGYSENSSKLLEELIQQLKSTNLSFAQFMTYQQSLLRQYQNFSKEAPLDQAEEIFQHAIFKDFSTNSQKAKAIQKVSYEKFQDYLKQLFQKTYVQGMIYGNLSESDAQILTNKLISTLNSCPYPKDLQVKREVIQLPETSGPFFLEQRSDVLGNAVILGIENGPFSFKSRAAQQILTLAMKEPFFTELRTKQQTGYIVYNTAEEWERQMFDLFFVQSNRHDVRDLLARLEQFIEGYLQELGKHESSEDRFDVIKKALLIKLEQPQDNLKDMGELLKTLAFKYDGDFDWMNKRIEGMKSLSYPEFLQLATQVLGRQNKKRLAILFKGITPESNSMEYKRLPHVNALKK